ncbi:MAG: nuclear transport factor 2 family protein [Gemmatimonadaceae bacterium]
MTNDHRKQAALDFLRAARRGDRDGAAAFLAAGARHHNAYFAAGMDTLLTAIVAAAQANPMGTMDVKHVLGDGDFVAVHSHVRQRPDDRGVAVVHLFRFVGDRIAEMWDVGQPIPAENPNRDGMF